eukprot:TRINITY_DN6403_c0_g1_i1.p1 TRINITY_DN6403_c0_g1~~TRINITY_DN6403_c0_g1_i1.p1  ORF type:complete len:407 (+),score=137.89 TRINITY_DN6403_c0_g1_i1:92-1312(+)
MSKDLSMLSTSSSSSSSANEMKQMEQKAREAEFKEVMKFNELVAKENRLLESYIQRYIKDEEKTEEKKRGKARRTTQMTMTLALPYKYNIAVSENEFRLNQLKAIHQKRTDELAQLKALIECLNVRLVELRKEIYEFRRDVVQNPEGGKVSAERVIRYFEEKRAQQEATMKKLRQKIQSTRSTILKQDAKLKKNELQGETLNKIDYHQLEIKNSQYQQRIEDKNAELLQLKQATGKTIQELNAKKLDLTQLLQDQTKLRKELKSKESSLQLQYKEIASVQNEIAKEKQKSRNYRVQQSNPDMPQVLDYVQQKSQMYDLEASARNWTRKVEIMQMAAKRARRILNTLRAEMPELMARLETSDNKRPSTGPASLSSDSSSESFSSLSSSSSSSFSSPHFSLPRIHKFS